MPYRVDLPDPPAHAIDRLIELGALDVEPVAGGIVALMPDGVPADRVAGVLGVPDVRVSPALGRDDESVWALVPRPVRTRTLLFVPAAMAAGPDAVKLVDSPAFGTGLHATTALCLQLIEDLLDLAVPDRLLDVGTGSGILALGALRRGLPHATGLDLDPVALETAAENARLNQLTHRLALVRGGPDAVRGAWPLVVANIRAADLMAMAPALVRRVGSGGHLVLSGIPRSVGEGVSRTYRRLGMSDAGVASRDGWVALVLRTSW